MDRFKIVISILGAVAMACMWSASPQIEYPTEISPGFIETSEPYAGTVYWIETIEPTAAPQSCAAVTAEKALHVREQGNADARVRGYLRAGEVVRVIGELDRDWLRIERGDLQGFARSKYLALVQCWDDE